MPLGAENLQGSNMSELKRKFEDKVVVITGAARGIGRAVSIAFGREGATVVGADICAPVNPSFGVKSTSPEDLTATGQAVVAAGGRWLGHIVDQREIGQLRELAQKVVGARGGVDILLANAGVQGFAPLTTMDDEHWRDHIDVNLTGTANVLRVFTPLLIARGGGRIIITSSTQGRHGTLHGAAYSASKWGLIGLMKSAALDLGQYGVTVNAVIPGLIDTELTRHEERYAQAIEASGGLPSGELDRDKATAKDALTRKSPLRAPWIDPVYVAPVILFLASPEANMVSGATYDATAGDSANYE